MHGSTNALAPREPAAQDAPQDPNAFWNPRNIEDKLKGRWEGARPEKLDVQGASIDSRTLAPRQLFVAIRGERTDGHDYLEQAARAGASFAIVERDITPPATLPCLRVASSREAFRALAAAYRRNPLASATVVAITGSAGKTSSVRLLAAALSASPNVSASVKSHNNELGLAITLLNAPPATQSENAYVVCETGTSGKGEITALADMCLPDHAIITRVAASHLDGLGSIEGVAEEKGALFDALAPGSLACAAADHALTPVITRNAIRGVEIRQLDRDIRVTNTAIMRDATSCNVSLADEPPVRLTIPMLGEHHARNAALVFAIARRLGFAPEDIAKGLTSSAVAHDRGAIERIAGIDILADAYNANPASMRAAFNTFAAISPESGSRVAVLADMLELADTSQALHEQILEKLAEIPRLRAVALVGPEMSRAAPALMSAGFEGDLVKIPSPTESNLAQAADLCKPGDLVLLKGSRGLKLERVAQAMRSRAPTADTACDPKADHR